MLKEKSCTRLPPLLSLPTCIFCRLLPVMNTHSQLSGILVDSSVLQTVALLQQDLLTCFHQMLSSQPTQSSSCSTVPSPSSATSAVLLQPVQSRSFNQQFLATSSSPAVAVTVDGLRNPAVDMDLCHDNCCIPSDSAATSPHSRNIADNDGSTSMSTSDKRVRKRVRRNKLSEKCMRRHLDSTTSTRAICRELSSIKNMLSLRCSI